MHTYTREHTHAYVPHTNAHFLKTQFLVHPALEWLDKVVKTTGPPKASLQTASVQWAFTVKVWGHPPQSLRRTSCTVYTASSLISPVTHCRIQPETYLSLLTSRASAQATYSAQPRPRPRTGHSLSPGHKLFPSSQPQPLGSVAQGAPRGPAPIGLGSNSPRVRRDPGQPTPVPGRQLPASHFPKFPKVS